VRRSELAPERALGMTNFFAELRRHFYRVAAAYAVAATPL
jgi:hypothetical protein